MNAYITPILTAAILFPILAGIAVIPYAVIQYRRYGSISKLKLLVVFSFSFYLLCAYFLIILPLPTRQFVSHLTTPWIQLVPFNALHYFITHTAFRPLEPSTYLVALKQSAFLQPFFNLVLTIPFGIFLRYIWRLSFKKVLLATFCLSLFFELTQLSGLYFIYPRPYRLFDVDDLILNTSGGVVGYLLEPFFTKLFPSMEQLNQDAEKERSVASFWRRAVAWVIDMLLLQLLFIPLELINRSLTLDSYPVFLGAAFLYFVVLPYFWHGFTVGKALVKIKLVSLDSSRIGFGQLLWRQFLFFGVALTNIGYFIPAVINQLVADQGKHFDFYMTLLVIAGILALLFLVNVFVLLFKRNSQMFYERLSHTKEVGH